MRSAPPRDDRTASTPKSICQEGTIQLRHTAFLSVAAATLLTACASGGPAPGEAAADNPFRYGVPTPPAATYQTADTMTMIMSMADGEMDMAMSSASTVELTFEADTGGVRASGTVSDHSVAMTSATLGNVEMGGGEVSGDLEFVIDALGNVEFISTPEVPEDGAMPAIPIQFNAQELLPRFPGRPLRPGDSWADTVAAPVDVGGLDLPMPIGGSGESKTIYTYALAGDTLVEGRTLQKITVSAVLAGQPTAEEGGEPMAPAMTMTLDGYILWDVERGLVAAADLVRTMDGSMSEAGMSISMTGAGRSTLRLVN